MNDGYVIYPFPVLFDDLLRLFFDSTDLFIKQVKKQKQKENVKEESSKPKGIICKQCLSYVTEASKAIEIQAQHQHRVTNPAGMIFDIRLYAQAVCSAEGAAISEFSWFSGYAWRIVSCTGCHEHLGWSFQQASSPDFYGLIADRLIDND